MSVLNMNRLLTPALQSYFDEHATCPSLDAWLSDKLSDEHKTLYSTLMQLRHDVEGQFPVDFDRLWPMLGYTRKDSAKSKLVDVCSMPRDYRVLRRSPEQPHTGGHNAEVIFLTFDAAQRFSLQSGTSRSKEIAEFFITALKVVQEYHWLSIHYDKRQAVMAATEATMLSFLEKGKKIVYMGDLGIINDEHLINWGTPTMAHHNTEI